MKSELTKALKLTRKKIISGLALLIMFVVPVTRGVLNGMVFATGSKGGSTEKKNTARNDSHRNDSHHSRSPHHSRNPSPGTPRPTPRHSSHHSHHNSDHHSHHHSDHHSGHHS